MIYFLNKRFTFYGIYTLLYEVYPTRLLVQKTTHANISLKGSGLQGRPAASRGREHLPK